MSRNIVGERHLPYVQDQIEARQKILGKKSKSSSDIVWANGRSSWVRLVSSVDISDEDISAFNTGSQSWETVSNNGIEIRNKFLELEGYTGNILSGVLILGGGVLNLDSSLKSGISKTSTTNPLNKNNYGFGGTEFGLNPIPGIQTFESKTYNNGSLREATLTILAHNKKQFEYLETVYLRLGYHMLLEWGNSKYPINESGSIIYEDRNYSLVDKFLFPEGDVNDRANKFFYSKIEEYRKNAQGNYDAFLARVKNFSWEFTNEGKYLITLTLISKGSIIDGLTLNKSFEQGTYTTGLTSDSSTNELENSFLNILNQIATPVPKNAEKEKVSFFGTIISELLDIDFSTLNNTSIEFESVKKNNKGDVIACFANFGESKFVRFIRFKTILETINALNLIKGSDNKNILVEFSTEDQYCFSNGRSISSDPSKMIITYKKEYPNFEIDIFTGEHQIPEFHTTLPNNEDIKVGNIMNLFFSWDTIKNVLSSNIDKETEEVYIPNFINSLLKEANNLLGGVNKLKYRLKEDQIIEFYDEVLPFGIDNVREYDEKTLFKLYGVGNESGSFVIDFNIKTEITNKLSSMIAMGAQANSITIGEDATLISKWNIGLVDRLYPRKLEIDHINSPLPPTLTLDDSTSNPEFPTQASNTSTDGSSNSFLNNEEKEIRRYEGIERFRAYRRFLKKFSQTQNLSIKEEEKNNGVIEYTGYTFPLVDLANSKSENSLIGFTENQKSIFKFVYTTWANNNNTVNPFIGFLPVNFTMTFDGLSGIKIFDKLSVDSRFLPSNYGEDLQFIITQLDHKIENNKWITTIGTQSVPKMFKENNLLFKEFDNFYKSLVEYYNEIDPSSEQGEVGSEYYRYSAMANALVDSFSSPLRRTEDKNQPGYYFLPEVGPKNSLQKAKGFNKKTPLISIGKLGENLKSQSREFNNIKLSDQSIIKTINGIEYLPSEIYKNQYNSNYYLMEPAAKALFELASFAKSVNINFTITSAYRNDTHNSKVGGAYDSAHKYGGAIDIGELYDAVGGSKELNINARVRANNTLYQWLDSHAPRFGWYNPYRFRDNRGISEVWHWEFWGIPGKGYQLNVINGNNFVVPNNKTLSVR